MKPRYYLFPILVLALLLSAPALGNEPEHPAGWAVLTVQGRGNQGSGFFINSNGYFITNDHVTKGQERVQIHTAHGKSYDAYEQKSAPHLDLALYQAHVQNTPSLVLASPDDIQEGMEIMAIGSPLGQAQFTARGTILNPFRSYQGLEYIETDMTLHPGISGSPLLSRDGLVLGVNTLTLSTGDERRALAVHLSDLLDFLTESKIPFQGMDFQYAQPLQDPPSRPSNRGQNLLFHLALWNILLLFLHLGLALYNRQFKGKDFDWEEEEMFMAEEHDQRLPPGSEGE